MKTLATLALIASTGVALAGGGSYDVSGTSIGQSDSKYTPLGETHLFIDLDSTHTLSDNGTPIAGMEGKCSGHMQVEIGAGAQGIGVCIWADKDGDKWFGSFTVTGMNADRVTQGTWYVTGGTGKFASATGGGSFNTLTNPDSGESKLDVFGSITLK